MPIASCSPEPIANKPACRRSWFSKTTLSAALAVALALLGGGRSDATTLTIGNVKSFKTGNTPGNLPGTWTLEDKDWTYLSDSGNWNIVSGTGTISPEVIVLSTNFSTNFAANSFSVGNLDGYHMPNPSTPLELQIGYQVHINGTQPLGPWTFLSSDMGQNFLTKKLEVWQDIYGSLADYNANTTPGSGTLSTRKSTNGSQDSDQFFSPGLIDLWVRNTIKLSAGPTGGAEGGISSMSDTFIQTNVPEIDPNSFGSALSLALGALAVLERRARRLREICLG